MNPQDPLANLHPLREPLAIGWWPPAPGWWLLLVTLILLLTTIIWLLVKRRRRHAYRRHALRRLDGLRAQYLSEGNNSHYLEQVNALLKSVALYACPRAGVAGQHGEHWRHFLNESLPPSEQLGPEFNDAVYRKTNPDIDIEQVHRAAHYWIKHHKVAQ